MARDFQFVPALWANEIMRQMTGIDPRVAQIIKDLPPMKIDPSLEAFFVAIALEHGTHPKPKFGIERDTLAREITVILSNHKGAPDVLEKVRKNYRELGGRLLDTDPQWFYTKLADAYLTWLYEQEESKALLPEALDKINSDVAARERASNGFRTRGFKI